MLYYVCNTKEENMVGHKIKREFDSRKFKGIKTPETEWDFFDVTYEDAYVASNKSMNLSREQDEEYKILKKDRTRAKKSERKLMREVVGR